MEVPDQKALWEDKHEHSKFAELVEKASGFAVSVADELLPASHILELGCGFGGDARYFASRGHSVLATDFSEQGIERSRGGSETTAEFMVLDMSEPMPFADATFDVVYAHLSLHYYADEKTREIIHEIARVLKPGGRLLFRCKSVHDVHNGQGEQIEPNMFVNNGHVRHLFSTEYARDILHGVFRVDKVTDAAGNYADVESDFVDCWATKGE